VRKEQIKNLCLVWLSVALAASTSGAETISALTQRTIEFTNCGNLDGFTGANQRDKVGVCTNDGGALRCVMTRSEPDTPTGGCHAEAHLAKFSNGELFGPFPGFRRIMTYSVKFDPGCDGADIAFFQLKNNEGRNRWDYLVALWRQQGSGGDKILLQTNPQGRSRILHCQLSRDGLPPLAAGQWHEVCVTGYFTKNADGWMQVAVDGHDLTWYRDTAGKRKVGMVVTGPVLADIADSQWQLQLGGYGYFKDQTTREAVNFVRDIRVESWQ
jgi:hypothetical protein